MSSNVVICQEMSFKMRVYETIWWDCLLYLRDLIGIISVKMVSNMTTVGERIKLLRKKRGWTQDQLGKNVGMHGRHVGRYETNKVRPSGTALQKLAEFFEISVDVLIYGDEQSRIESAFKDKELIKLLQGIETLEEKDRMIAKGVIPALVMKKQFRQVINQHQ
jgi:transcriptional regulator with XRE-family HTH domain